MVTYPAIFKPAKEGGFVITLPDFDWAISQGENEQDAVEMARDMLSTVLNEEIAQGRELPPTDPAVRPDVTGRHYRLISIPALQSAKVELYVEFRRSGITKAELARRTGINKVNVDRLFSLRHASRLEQIEAAFQALGKRLILTVQSAA